MCAWNSRSDYRIRLCSLFWHSHSISILHMRQYYAERWPLYRSLFSIEWFHYFNTTRRIPFLLKFICCSLDPENVKLPNGFGWMRERMCPFDDNDDATQTYLWHRKKSTFNLCLGTTRIIIILIFIRRFDPVPSHSHVAAHSSMWSPVSTFVPPDIDKSIFQFSIFFSFYLHISAFRRRCHHRHSLHQLSLAIFLSENGVSRLPGTRNTYDRITVSRSSWIIVYNQLL